MNANDIIVTISQKDVDNLVAYMQEKDYDDTPLSVLQAAATTFFEQAVDDLCADPEWAYKNFGYRWDAALSRATSKVRR